jgi:recombination protein RecR
MNILPEPLKSAIDALRLLPGVGPRSAERYAYFLLKNDPTKAKQIAKSLENLHDRIDFCQKTFALVQKGQKYSDLYTNPKRDKTVVAVVAEPFDIIALENAGNYSGTYHVLGGLISPIDGIDPENLKVRELIKRIDQDKVSELILATNASVEGESTALYIKQQLGDRQLKLTRLARGIPIGVDLEYADQITLSRAIENRTEIQ